MYEIWAIDLIDMLQQMIEAQDVYGTQNHIH